MSDLSFALAGKKTTLVTNNVQNQRIDLPYDDKLNFNRVISRPEGAPADIIYSINPNAILRKLTRDELGALVNITLGCRPTRNGVGMWDTLFNLVSREALTGCVFLAKADYTPVGQDRVVVASQFLNFSMAVTRVHLNRVETGDKIGIGIYDVQSHLSYVLLYDVTGNCMVSSPDSTSNEEGRPIMIPAINCRLEQLYRVGANGEADVVDVEEREDNSVATAPFIQHIVDAVSHVPSAFPWKPHFLPQSVKAFDREALETDILARLETADEASYDVFEEACRGLYEAARARKPSRTRRDGQRRPKNQGPKIPIIQVASLSSGSVLVQFPDNNGTAGKTYRFDKDSVGRAAVTERFLLNQDLDGKDLSEVSNILVLSEDKFGPNGIVRYLTVNY